MWEERGVSVCGKRGKGGYHNLRCLSRVSRISDPAHNVDDLKFWKMLKSVIHFLKRERRHNRICMQAFCTYCPYRLHLIILNHWRNSRFGVLHVGYIHCASLYKSRILLKPHDLLFGSRLTAYQPSRSQQKKRKKKQRLFFLSSLRFQKRLELNRNAHITVQQTSLNVTLIYLSGWLCRIFSFFREAGNTVFNLFIT